MGGLRARCRRSRSPRSRPSARRPRSTPWWIGRGSARRSSRCSSSPPASTRWWRSSRSGSCSPSCTRARSRRACARRRPPSGRSSTSRSASRRACCSTCFWAPRPPADPRNSRLFVALAGAIVVASGASYYLNLSPLYTNLVLGFILANSGGSHRDVTRLLLATERPVYLALLHFCRRGVESGVARSPVHRAGVRGRPPGGRASSGAGSPAMHVAPPALRTPALARGLLAQGGIGVAHRAQLHPGVARPESPADPELGAALDPALRVRGGPGGAGLQLGESAGGRACRRHPDRRGAVGAA